jgi:hypothetical protein
MVAVPIMKSKKNLPMEEEPPEAIVEALLPQNTKYIPYSSLLPDRLASRNPDAFG